MKLYHILNQFYGTQADAKAAAKAGEVKFDPAEDMVEVPTDKEGLIDYLNRVIRANRGRDHNEDEFETVVERQDPKVDETDDAPQPLNLSYLQTFFDQAPISLRLELAVRAIDAADAALRPLPGSTTFGGKRAEPAVTLADFDEDELMS